MIGIALAFPDAGTEDFRIITAILCMLFAFVMQIDANFINDYFDFKRGNDDETRLGPKRACSEGWITPSAMLKGIIATIATTPKASLSGLPPITLLAPIMNCSIKVAVMGPEATPPESNAIAV